MASPNAPQPNNTRTIDGKTQWDRVSEMDEFRLLLLAKVGFVVPATIFFVAYYFALPILVGYAPNFMSKKIWGPVNLAYLFALSQFFMAWAIAALYVNAAKKFDMYGHHIMDHLKREGWFHVDEDEGGTK
jgi:uncharacterized membrane protein (DUF485 family)